MTISKFLFYFILFFIILSGVIFWKSGDDSMIRVADAAGGMPWQDGGIITKVTPQCILDTPPPAPTTCGISCPFVSSVYSSACVGYTEVWTQSQHGTQFLAVPIGFIYSGGGLFPRPGQQYIAGGALHIMPWVIGIPQ